jgi:hypothetical protein
MDELCGICKKPLIGISNRIIKLNCCNKLLHENCFQLQEESMDKEKEMKCPFCKSDVKIYKWFCMRYPDKIVLCVILFMLIWLIILSIMNLPFFTKSANCYDRMLLDLKGLDMFELAYLLTNCTIIVPLTMISIEIKNWKIFRISFLIYSFMSIIFLSAFISFISRNDISYLKDIDRINNYCNSVNNCIDSIQNKIISFERLMNRFSNIRIAFIISIPGIYIVEPLFTYIKSRTTEKVANYIVA